MLAVVKGLEMDKWLCWGALSVAGVFGLLFLLDFVFSLIDLSFLPFGGVSATVDVACILASAILGYLSWNALKDIR
jgi:hypothetical protein